MVSGEVVSGADGGPIRSYRDLDVWALGVELATLAYAIGRRLPKEERFGLTSQIQRAATSVPANIAEGHGRESTREFIRFLRVAQGSLKELETHLIVAERVGLVRDDDVSPALELSSRLGRMIRGLIRSLESRR